MFPLTVVEGEMEAECTRSFLNIPMVGAVMPSGSVKSNIHGIVDEVLGLGGERVEKPNQASTREEVMCTAIQTLRYTHVQTSNVDGLRDSLEKSVSKMVENKRLTTMVSNSECDGPFKKRLESDDFRDLFNLAASGEMAKTTHAGNWKKVHGNLAIAAAYAAVKPRAFVKF